jgi:hypothetical protein
MDHDSLAGAREFIKAGEIAGIATTVGMEFRVNFPGAPLENRRINNPNQIGSAYMALHGIPHQKIDFAQQTFAPLREKRNARNRKIIKNINVLMAPYGLYLDFNRDILPLSGFNEGGTITERHLLFALGGRLKKTIGPASVAGFLTDSLGITLTEVEQGRLVDPANPYFDYDLLDVLKAKLIGRIYVPASDECLTLAQASEFAKKTGGLLCYEYLGNVGDSSSPDRKAQQFEDACLDEVARVLYDNDVGGITYKPSQITPEQYARIRELCSRYGFREILGEDISSPRQQFICRQLELPEYAHLARTAWELIERERALSSAID